MINAMKEATIFRVRSDDKFCRIPNETLQDEKLSFKAKGILAYLLSKPQGWMPRVTDIANNGSDGKAAITSGLVELREQNYAELQELYRGGKVVAWRMMVADSRMFKSAGEIVVIHIDKLETENLVLGFPLLENLVLENRGHSNTVLVERQKDSNTEISAGAVSEDGKTKTTADGKQPPKVPDAPSVPPPPTEYQKFVAGWDTMHMEVFGEKYDYSNMARDGKQLKEKLAAGKTAAELLEVARLAWNLNPRTEKFRRDQSMTIHGLCQNLPEIKVALRSSGGKQKSKLEWADYPSYEAYVAAKEKAMQEAV